MVANQMMSEAEVEAANGRVARSQRVIDSAFVGQIELRQMQVAALDIRLARAVADVDKRVADLQGLKASQSKELDAALVSAQKQETRERLQKVKSLMGSFAAGVEELAQAQKNSLTETEKRKARFSDDRRGDRQRGLHDQRWHDIGQDMPQRNAQVRVAECTGRLHVVLDLDRLHLRAGQADEDRRRRYADRDHCVGEARSQESSQRDREDQKGRRQHRIGDPRDERIGPASGVAREEADRNAKRQRDTHGNQTGQQ